MNNYQHEWGYDWARYAVIIKNGAGIHEFKSKEDAINFDAMTTDFKITQRYTDQQMELETQGWTLWNAGAGNICPVGNNVEVEVASIDRFNKGTAGEFGWAAAEELSIIAYRITSTGYNRDADEVFGKKLSVNDNPEWKAGLPPVNSECEVEINKETSGFIDCEILFISNEWAVFNCKFGELAYKTSKLEFRPIQSERDKVIAKAKSTYDNGFTGCIYEELYDAGMLSMPDKGES